MRIDSSARRIRIRGRIATTLTLDEAASHKLLNVLRLGPGDEFTVIDDEGVSRQARITSGEDNRVVAETEAESGGSLAPLLPIRVAIGVIKGSRMDWAVEKLAEAGAAAVVPLVSDCCVVRTIGREKIERWRRIAASAALQSGHALETLISDPAQGLDEVCDRSASEKIWYLDPVGLDIRDILSVGARSFQETHHLLLVGPEGGWSSEEKALLEKLGTGLSIGNSIFRTETASLIGLFSIYQIVSKR